MKIVTVAGPPYAGKTMVIAHLVRRFTSMDIRAAAAKFDATPANGGVFHKSELKGPLSDCSCHFGLPGFLRAPNIKDVFEWGRAERIEVLFVETPVLCCKWVPFANDIPVVTVVANCGGMGLARRTEQLLRLADAVVVTKTDLVSELEEKRFQSEIRNLNPTAPIVRFNGLNGNGSYALNRIVDEFEDAFETQGTKSGFSPPVKIFRFESR